MAQDNVNIYMNQNTLNTVTKDYRDSRRWDFEHPKNDLVDIIRAKSNTVDIQTRGDYEFAVDDSHNFSARPVAENGVIPDGANKFDSVWSCLSLTHFMSNAELTSKMMKFQNNDYGTYFKVVDKSLSDMLYGNNYYMSVMFFGNGTGQVATVGTTGSAVASGATGSATCDNTYADLGIDNVKFLREGVSVEFYRTSGGTTSKVGQGNVTKVDRKVRRNADNNQTGTFYFTNTGTSSYTPTDNDMVFIAGTYGSSEIPQGLRKIVNPACGSAAGNTVFGVDPTAVFQGLYRGKKGSAQTIARNSTSDPFAEIFRSSLYRTNSSGVLGLVSNTSDISTYAGNKLADWDLGTLRGILSDIDYQSKNGGRVDTLLMNQFMADMIFKLAKDQVDIVQTVIETDNTSVIGRDILRATQFRKENGEMVNIHVTDWMPDNEITGLCTEDLFVLQSGAFGFLNREGGAWEHTYGNNRDNYQAPYEGYINLGAYRCDKHFTIQGLKDINS